MSFEFQSTLVDITSDYRIAGNQIGGARIETIGDVKTLRIVVVDDTDIRFAASGPYETGDPDAIYAALSADLYEIAPGILINEGAVSSVDAAADSLVIDFLGEDHRYKFVPSADFASATEIASHTWALPEAGFQALKTAAGTWRSSLDGSLEGLANSISAESAARIAADGVLQADIDQNEVDGDAADAALSGRLDVLEADPTTATAVAAGDAATLSSANGYTDAQLALEVAARTTAISGVQSDVDQNEADSDAADAALSGRLDVLESDPTTATAVAAVQSDVDQNEADSDAADAALSGRLDVLEADPTTATAVAAVQSDVDQNEADSDAADAALSARLDVLEADPTTATAVAAVQSDVDQNEADADAALALRALLDGSNIPGPYNNDTEAAAGGVPVGGIYKNSNGTIHWRVS